MTSGDVVAIETCERDTVGAECHRFHEVRRHPQTAGRDQRDPTARTALAFWTSDAISSIFWDTSQASVGSALGQMPSTGIDITLPQEKKLIVGDYCTTFTSKTRIQASSR